MKNTILNSFKNNPTLFLGLSTILFCFLFYLQNFGYNLLLFSLLLMNLLVLYKPTILSKTNAKIHLGILIITSFSSAYYADWFSITYTVILLFFLPAMTLDTEKKLLYAPFKTIWSYLTSPLRLSKLKLSNKSSIDFGIKKIALYVLLPLAFFLIFLPLYTYINEDFSKTINSINLDFLDLNLFFMFAFGFVLLFPFWFYPENLSFKETAVEQYTQENFSTQTQESEKINLVLYQSGVIVFIILNLLIASLLFFDFQGIINKKIIASDFNYSNYVHEGVTAVIFSIIMAIIVILIYFSRELNFSSDKKLRLLAITWIILNSLLLISTAWKNQIYIENQGLTLKRLGVYGFLILCSAGLIISFLKLHFRKTNYFLFNKTNWTVLIFFALICPINWSKLITVHNINEFKHNGMILDLQYLYSLPFYNYRELEKFEEERETFTFSEREKILNNPNEYQLIEREKTIESAQKNQKDLRSASFFMYEF